MLLAGIIVVLIGLVGLSAYYTSAHFGCRSSGADLLPPRYTHVPDNSKTSSHRH
ncbi:hypothetical protein [uncultured Fibrella sp.]|uniref:hypothetical protein n=1 Tax=uncultured Fibrella sp. TaxID=1284596 RepID=UPI0035CC4243